MKMKLFVFECESEENDPEYVALSDRIIDKAQERCFIDGIVPLAALRCGISDKAKPLIKVDVVDHKDLQGGGEIVIDEDGHVWYRNIDTDDGIWKRYSKY